jgi:CheY-like chemotaxis protein
MQAELVKTVEDLPEVALKGLNQISADAMRAAELTRQLLLFGRRQVMQTRVLDLNDHVTNMSSMLRRLIREDVELQVKLNPEPLMTRADAGMLDQVLMNLALNARDAMPKGGCLVLETWQAVLDAAHARLHPDAAPGCYACLSVSDTGTGIAPEVLPQIFEPFFTTKDVGKGSGLGLATVFGIVKQHGGWIEVDNRPGQGAAFRVFFPLSATTVAAPAQAKGMGNPLGGTETILVVEDEPALLASFSKFLQRRGYKVLEAANGQEALRRWEENKGAVSVLLTDLVMPGGMSGQELARRLRTEQPGLKVILASGYSADIAGQELPAQTGDAFIQKPFGTDLLLETIRRSLDG